MPTAFWIKDKTRPDVSEDDHRKTTDNKTRGLIVDTWNKKFKRQEVQYSQVKVKKTDRHTKLL